MSEEVDKNGGEWSVPLNMADWSNHLIFDTLGDLCFGKSFGMMEPNSELRYVPELMTDSLAIIHPVSHIAILCSLTDINMPQIAFSPFTSFWVWLKPRGLNSLLAATAPPALANWAGFVGKCFNERAKVEQQLRKEPKPESEQRKDFFHYLFGAVEPETGKPGYSLNELLGESEMLIIASSATIVISTAASMFYLVRNPDVQKRLAREIHGAFSSVDDITGGTKLQSDCKYLQSFIKEVLRMSPPVPAEMSREVLAGGITIDGEYLPSGVRASSCSYILHHNPDLYNEPFKFRPERWIVGERGSTVESVVRAENGYCPFSGGPRGCVGKNLAYLEMSVVIAKVMYQFELRQDEKSGNLGGGSLDGPEGRRIVDQYQLYDIFVATRDGPMVQIKRRV